MKKDYKITIFKEVNYDLDEIEEYIIREYESAYIAYKISSNIRNAISTIPPFPNSYPSININNYNIRKKKCGKYQIFFECNHNEINIIGIFHSRRLIENIYKTIIERINSN